MSFEGNYGKPHVEPRADQCEMLRPLHPDDPADLEPQCLEPSVGTVPESCDVRVCVSCALAMQGEGFLVTFYDAIGED